jgi:hypothetical protein
LQTNKIIVWFEAGFLTMVLQVLCKTDYSLFTRLNSFSYIALFIYVDDVAIASNDYKAVSDFIILLNDRFQLKDIGH